MIKKIFWIIISIIILYIITIFLSPKLSKSLWETFWLSKFNEQVINLKKKLDNSSTNSWNTSDNIYSWAIDIKNTVVNWIDKTKDAIDEIRVQAQWIEQKYEETKKVLNDVKQIWDWISNIVNTWSVK